VRHSSERFCDWKWSFFSDDARMLQPMRLVRAPVSRAYVSQVPGRRVGNRMVGYRSAHESQASAWRAAAGFPDPFSETK